MKRGSEAGGEETTAREQVRPTVTDEAIFKVAKEIVVKFIEVGRLTPNNFEDTFKRVYTAIERAVRRP